MNASKDKNDYSPQTIIKRRKFPARNTLLISLCVVAQVLLIFLAIIQKAEPDDIIEKYNVTVEPLENGTLDIEYSFLWKAVDEKAELTWVEIGLPNSAFEVYEDSVSQSIKEYSKINDDGYTGIRLDFTDSYKDGETVEFSFKVNQDKMICNDFDGYFYEFVPCWFNSIPVENYEFKWKITDSSIYNSTLDAKTIDDYIVYSGSLNCGEYKMFRIHYDSSAFDSAKVNVVEHEPFYEDGAYNQLEENKTIKRFFLSAGAFALLFVETYFIDSYVSYRRGRGFLTGYGHPVHVYGYQNPKYTKAYNRAHIRTSSGGGHRGGGCACACACACAGGGRAGCSQKDTTALTLKKLP